MENLLYKCRTLSAPLRKEGSHSSEMISELLYGEYMTATGEQTENWMQVQCEWDDYVGWISKGQVETVSDFEMYNVVNLSTDTKYYPGSIISTPLEPHMLVMSEFMARYMDVPYYWGGRSTYGIDCSGLSQIYYKLKAIRIPRDASVQAMCGDEFQDISEAREGDLAFFENEKGAITHVAIFLDSERVLHATASQGRVVIDQINSSGIINSETGTQSHNLKKMVKIFFDSDHLIASK